MRSRNIKPGFFKNEDLGELNPLCRLFFAGLWCMADKEGRIECRPKRLKIEILPYDDLTIKEINGYLTVLSRTKFTMHYRVEERTYIEILNFKKHQSPHHTEKDSQLPELTNNNILTVDSPFFHGGNPPDSLIPDSLIPDSVKTPTEPIEMNLSCLLLQLLKEHRNGFKKPNLKKWSIEMERIIRIDKRDPAEIEDVIFWCQKDEFWQGNILSVSKLRKQYDQLALKMNKKPFQKETATLPENPNLAKKSPIDEFIDSDQRRYNPATKEEY